MGPFQGMSEMCSAALAPVSARTSALFCLSLERTVAMICVSFLKPSGKRGRSGRSMMRQARISSSRWRASRLKKPPGILPRGVGLLDELAGEGEEVEAGPLVLAETAVTSTIVSP